MSVKLAKYYKWVQTESVAIPVHESDGIEINQMIEPLYENSWYRRDYLNIKQFNTVEEAEAALVQWCETYNKSWETFILQTCYRVEK